MLSIVSQEIRQSIIANSIENYIYFKTVTVPIAFLGFPP